MTDTQTIYLVIQIIIPVASVGAFYGAVNARLKSIEKKQDKHNKLIERMYRAESDLSNCDRRIAHLEALREEDRRREE